MPVTTHESSICSAIAEWLFRKMGTVATSVIQQKRLHCMRTVIYTGERRQRHWRRLQTTNFIRQTTIWRSQHCDTHNGFATNYQYLLLLLGVVALSVEYRTYEREVVGSSLGRARGVETLGKFLTPVCLCSPSSTTWYRPKGGDALRLGSKGRYGLCVGGR